MKVEDVFKYFSRKVPIIVTQGCICLYSGPRDKLPADIKEMKVVKYQYLIGNGAMWVLVE